jgi:antitoxin (DNA-binding transcriptional repressor) of toxin-antitoxin stability system
MLMEQTITIHQAKTNLSRIVQRARLGHTTYIGSYGKPEAIIAPLPKRSTLDYGVLAGKFDDIDDSALVGIDPDIQEMFYGKDWNRSIK